jgi:hypothetical protein
MLVIIHRQVTAEQSLQDGQFYSFRDPDSSSTAPSQATGYHQRTLLPSPSKAAPGVPARSPRQRPRLRHHLQWNSSPNQTPSAWIIRCATTGDEPIPDFLLTPAGSKS